MNISPWPWPSMPISALRFTDLFLGEQEADIRGLYDDVEDAPVLRRVPGHAFTDLDALRSVVFARRDKAEFLLEYDGMRFRASRIDNISGTWYALRRCMSPIPLLDSLNIGRRPLLDHLRSLGQVHRSGLLLISGAMGHGKTTTACSLLQEWLTLYGNIAVTIEDPIEMVLDGTYGDSGRCFQTQAPNGDFGEAMRLTARRSPRYVLLGEVRSQVEASAAIRAAVNGQLVLTTIHSGDPIGAIQSLVKLASMNEDAEMARSILADGLLGVVHQRLVRVRHDDGWNLEPQISCLFFPEGPGGSRGMVRSDKLIQLTTTIAAQAARLAAGKSPLEPRRLGLEPEKS